MQKVYIAGAGPGDAGLITVKLKEVLGKADVIIYDRLINKRILAFCKKECELIYLGKGNKEGGTLQEKINQTILEKALEGKMVLRLHGGDPYVFGRGGEEAQVLFDNGIAFEIIPGISSSVAVPAYAGIPVTMRGLSSSFHLFTGKNKEGKLEVDFSVLPKLKGSLIFLMGVESLSEIVSNLVNNGIEESMSAALIERGTTGVQRKVVGTLSDIVGLALENKIEPPSIFIVSKTVVMTEKLKWFENKPLFGKKVVVTRNHDGFESAAELIEENGGVAVEFPMIDIEYCSDAELAENLEKLIECDTFIINSANGVRSIFGRLEKLGFDLRKFARQKIGVIGDGTEKELRKFGIIPDIKPGKYTTESVIEEAVKKSRDEGKIIIATSDISPINVGKLAEKYTGNSFEKISIYKTIEVEKTKEEYELLLAEMPDYITFLSSSAVKEFFKGLQKNRLKFPEKTKIASIGPITSKTIETFGVKVDIEAEIYTVEGLINKICEIEMSFK